MERSTRLLLVFRIFCSVCGDVLDSAPDDWRDYIPSTSRNQNQAGQNSDLPNDWRDYVPGGASANSLPLRADLFEGDILVPTGITVQGMHRNAINDEQALWPKKKVIYQISNAFGDHNQRLIQDAMRAIQSQTCVTFERRTNQNDFIHIQAGHGCSSYVGRVSGQQPVSLGSGCLYHNTIIHELLHAMGFFHEQSRSDRSQHVRIFRGNINLNDEEFRDNFGEYRTNNQGFGYDYGSLMHYDAYAFAKNKELPTILPKLKGIVLGPGNRMGLSLTDIEKIRKLYKCGDAPAPAPAPAPPSPPSSNIQWRDNWAHGCNFVGNDITSLRTEGKDCGPKCEETSECTHFHWGSGVCWLKRGGLTRDRATKTDNEDNVCGVRTGKVSWHEGTWARHCDFPGKDLENFKTEPHLCGQRCWDNRQCTHHAYSEGKCWLKKDGITKDKAQYQNDPQRVCGVVERG